MFWTFSEKQTCPSPWRRRRVAVPLPSGSAGSGCSETPSRFRLSVVMPLPPVVGDSSDLGHAAGAGMMSAAFAVYDFSCFEPTATTRWYAEPTLWQTGVLATVLSCDACATPNDPSTSRGTARSSNLRMVSSWERDRLYVGPVRLPAPTRIVLRPVQAGPDARRDRARPGRVEDQVRDERRPSGLVGRTEPGAVVAVEVLVERQVALPRRVCLELLRAAVDGAPAIRTREPDGDEPVGEVLRDLREAPLLARAGRVLELEAVAEEAVVDHELADRQVVDRHPDRPAPVGVAAEHRRRRLCRLVVDPCAGHALERVRVVFVALRHRAQAVRREERLLVEELLERVAEVVRIDHREQHRAVVVADHAHATRERPARLLIALAQPCEALAEAVGGARGAHRDPDRRKHRQQPRDRLHPHLGRVAVRVDEPVV